MSQRKGTETHRHIKRKEGRGVERMMEGSREKLQNQNPEGGGHKDRDR